MSEHSAPTAETAKDLQGHIKDVLDKSLQVLNDHDDEKFSWSDAGVVTIAGAALFGFAGLAAGAAAAWFILPVVAGWAGAAVAASAAAGTALATTTGSFLGLSAVGWAGAVAGIALGALTSFIPLSRTNENKIEYTVQSIITKDIAHKVEEDTYGRPMIDMTVLPRTKVNETNTVTSYRLGNLMEDTVGVGVGLVTAFAGAAAGFGVAGIIKLAEVRQGMYNYTSQPQAKKPPAPPVT